MQQTSNSSDWNALKLTPYQHTDARDIASLIAALIHLNFLSCRLLNVVDDKLDGRKVTMTTALAATPKKSHKVSLKV